MPVLDRNFLFNLETSWQELAELEMQRLVSNLWYQTVMKTIPIKSGKEIFAWVLNNAVLEGTGMDPSVRYRSMAILESTVIPEYNSGALELQRAQFEDLDGNGIDVGSDWVTQMTSQAIFLPQRLCALMLMDGYSGSSVAQPYAFSNGICYDGLQFFSQVHPVDQTNNSVGVFANVFTGNPGNASSQDPNQAVYPGAIDIRIGGPGGATVDSAFAALQNAYKYIRALKMPNGIDPRYLIPKYTLNPTTLFPHMVNLLDSKWIAMSSKGGGGSTEISGQLQKYGYGTPLECPELNADPNVFYIVAEQAASSRMGGLVYALREPSSIRYHDRNTNNYLDENDLIHWIMRGRSAAAYGHPYYVFQCRVQ